MTVPTSPNPGTAPAAPPAGAPPAGAPPTKSPAQNHADAAKKKALSTGTSLQERWEKADQEFKRLSEAAQQIYDEAVKAVNANQPSDPGFNKAADEWEEAAAVDIHSSPLSPEAELTSARGVAKEWLAAALAVFGFFSFTAIFFGGDTLKVFEDQRMWRIVIFTVIAVVAIAAAVGCCFWGTRAAHGWVPREDAKFWDLSVYTRPRTPRSPQEKLMKARQDLIKMLYAAGLTVLAVVGGLIFVLATQVATPAPLLAKVMPKNGDDPLTCGTYKSADDKGITVTDKDKNAVTTAWSEVGKVEAVRGC